ncbi:MAG TPA: hypothetical protein VJ464_23680 [Blastocatellia bacterium]|nr:hypothetical protein [Blastocatellia bacterium]
MNIEDLQMGRLVVSAPPMLAQAIGYPGCARYVAFYWTPYGDVVIYSDGRLSADGHWHSWLLFTRHNSIAPHLEGYNLGSSDEEATHWLLVDQETCVLYAGTPGEVLRVLRGQYADQAPDSELRGDGISDEITLDNFRSLIDSFVELNGPKTEEIIEAMRKQDALTEELRAWLDSNTSSESS